MTSCDSSSTPNTGSPRRHFLGWDAPILPTAAAWLFDRLAPGAQEADLSGTLLVVPGARSGRLLLGMLVDEAASRRASFVPPLLVTPGEIIEPLLGVPRERPAGPIARHLAWSRALEAANLSELEPLLGTAASYDPSSDEHRQRVRSLGSALEPLYVELGAHGLRFESVIETAKELGGSREADRWRSAASLAARFRSALVSLGLSDEVESRIAMLEGSAARSEGRSPACITRIVLVGTPELPGLAARALLSSANRGQSVDVLIHAPDSIREAFDDLGCVRPEAWTSRTLPIDENQIAFAESSTDQAKLALAWLATVGTETPVNEVAIGLADESLADLVAIELRRYSTTRVRAAPGCSAAHAEPSRVLTLASDLVERRGFHELVALARHPRVEQWLLSLNGPARRRADWAWWLTALDQYDSAQTPGKLGRLPAPTEPEWEEALDFVSSGIAMLLGNLWSAQEHTEETTLNLAEFSLATLELLDRLYGREPASPSDPNALILAEACIAIAEDLNVIRSISSVADANWPRERPSAHLDWLISLQTLRTIASPPDADAIEMIGWLELAHDPSPVAVVLGLDDRSIPGVRDLDAFLPASLRKILSLPTSATRLARDSFLASTMARSRRQMLFVAPRRDEDGLPLIPSRVLLRCDNGTLPSRLMRALGRGGITAPEVSLKPRSQLAIRSGYPIAPLASPPRVSHVRVTAFRDYLASPYLFYLRHVLRLQEAAPSTGEMDAMAFGTLLHNALERFGRSDARDSTDAKVIRACVLDHLNTIASARFGTSPPVAVLIQKSHAIARLSRWAEVQAAHAASGWRIHHVEWSPQRDESGEARAPRIEVAEGTIALRGRIDRIDVHEVTGHAMVLDYKSSDTASHPAKAHRALDGTWRDLQLPLYRDLLRPLSVPAEISLGYFNVPRDLNRIEIAIAQWDDAELASADEAARNVVAGILKGEFAEVGNLNDDGTLGLIAGIGVLSSTEAAPSRETHQ